MSQISQRASNPAFKRTAHMKAFVLCGVRVVGCRLTLLYGPPHFHNLSGQLMVILG